MPDATPQKCSLTPVNDKAVLLNFEGAETTSNAGLMLLSKTDQKLGLSSSLASCFKDPRDPAKTLHSLEEIIGFRASMIAAGYEDGNDANKLRHDPSFKLALERTPETGAALCSQSTISRMENMANTRSLYRMGHEMARVYCGSFKRTPKKMVLDIDETFDETHGDQQLSLFNSYYGGWGYQPILVFDEEERLVASVLRPAGRPSGKEAAGLIQRLIHSLRRHWPNTEFLLRADGHYSTPEVMDLCDTLGVDYVFGLPTNSRMRKHVETREADTEKHYKQHYAGKRTKLRRFQEFSYGARSWGGKERRVIARIEVGPMGRDTRFIVTSLNGHRSKYLYEKIYCARGQAENYIKSWKRHLASDRTSCSKANANQMRLMIHHCAYRLMWTLRAACPKRSRWRRAQFDTLRLHLIKIAATVVEKKTRIVMSLPASCPHQSLIRLLFEALAPPHSAGRVYHDPITLNRNPQTLKIENRRARQFWGAPVGTYVPPAIIGDPEENAVRERRDAQIEHFHLNNPTVGLYFFRMVVIHRAHGFRFIIYTADHGPAHIHITGVGQAKIDLSGPGGRPEAVYFIGIKRSDQRRLMADVIEHQDEFLAEWERIHGKLD